MAEDVERAYDRMATVGYRPAAPSDGFGRLTVPALELDLDAERRAYAERWREEERDRLYRIGVPDGRTLAATVFAVEAARLLCAADPKTAARLLRMALDDLAT